MHPRLLSAALVVSACVFLAVQSAHALMDGPTKCDAAKLKAAGKTASLIANAHAKNLTKPNNAALSKALAKAETLLLAQFTKAEQNLCSVEGNAAEVLSGINAFSSQLQAPVDIVLKGDLVSTPLGNVTATGTVTVSPDGGEVTGSVSVALTPAVSVVVKPTASGGLEATVGGHLLAVDAIGSNITFDGIAISLEDIVTALFVDTENDEGPELWSPLSQAWFALLGLMSTPAWQANTQAELALEREHRNARGIKSWTCKKSVAVATPVLVHLAARIGCAKFGLLCVAGTIKLGPVALKCGTAYALCEIAVAAIDGGLDASAAVRNRMESSICPSSACEADREVRTCYHGEPTTRGVGACHDGLEVCRSDGTGFGSCGGEQRPGSEICGNSTDENCNGLSDSLDPACGGGGVVGIQQLTTGGVGATNEVLLTGDARVVVFNGALGVVSVRTDATDFRQYPKPPDQVGCEEFTGDCNYCLSPPTAPAVDGTGALIAYHVGQPTCGGNLNAIVVPNGDDAPTPFGWNTQFPSVSADGSRIAFLRGNAAFEVWVSDPSGLLYSNRVVSCCSASEPKISGNGARIVYKWGQSTNGLAIVDVDGGESTARFLTPLDANPRRFAVSADGTKVVFDSARDLVPGENVDLSPEVFLWRDGIGLQQLTDTTAGAGSPTISADGSLVAFLFGGDIYVIDLPAGAPRRVVDIPPTAHVSLGIALDTSGDVVAFASTADLTGQNASGFTEIFVAQVP